VLPKGYKALVLDMQHFPSPRTIAVLQGLGITDVVVHLDDFDAVQRAEMEKRLDQAWDGLSQAAAFADTRVYRVAPSEQLARLHAAIQPGASVMLSREDPQGTGAYMAMLGYVLRDHPLYARLRVDFGETYRGPPVAGEPYDYAILYRDEDPADQALSGDQVIWEDSVARVYRRASP